MSSEQQSCLRFSVEESIWFQKGQEVAELISISLDPDIQIYEQDQYVSIRGALLLTGEYHVNTGEAMADEDYQPQARVVQEVEEREDGVCSLHHRFPVDITIPKNRIQNLDDIYVAIESFDYSVPNRGCLQLDAELSISGIYGHQQSTPSWEDEEQEQSYEVEPNRDHEESYASHNQAYLMEEAEEQEEVEEEETHEYEPMYRSEHADNEFEEDTYKYYAEDEEEEEILNQHEIDANADGVSYSYNDDGDYAPFEVEARKQPVSEDAPYNPADFFHEEKEVENTYAPLYSLHSNRSTAEETEAVQNVSYLNKHKAYKEAAEAEDYEDGPRNENDLSLTKIFAEEDGEEFTRLKICIVQQGESMDHIAERYDVSIQQLIRVNRLSTDEHVNEGQLLYIPVKAGSK